MKKLTLIIIIMAFAIFSAAPAYAQEAEPYLLTPDTYRLIGAEGLVEALPEETRESLARLGMEDIDLYALLRASPRDILVLLFDLFNGALPRALRAGMMALCIVIMLSFGFSAMPEDEKIRHAVEVAGSMLALLLLLPGLSSLMKGAAAVIRAGNTFGLALIPVLAGIVTAAGNPSLALGYHTLTLFAARGLSQLTDGVVIPCTGVVLGLSLVDAAAKDANLSKLAGAIKKAVIGSFAVLAGLFSALLSVKSLIASAADALVIRGAKVAAGSVPLVGSALSESVGAILGSVSLLKGAVGGFALIAALVLYAPILIELLLWSVMLKLLSAASELFAQEKAAGVFKSAANAIAILSACVIFNAALLLISTGLVMSIRNS